MSRRTVASMLALIPTVVGSVFIGGALWVAQGTHRGPGDAMGIGILVSLGAALIVFGLGTALAYAVTYLAHVPEQAEAEDAVAPNEGQPEESTVPHEAARPKRARRPWWPFGQRA